MPSLSTLGQYTTAPKRCVLRVLTAVAPLGAMNVYIILDVSSGYGRGTARRRSCIVVVWRPCRLQGLAGSISSDVGTCAPLKR